MQKVLILLLYNLLNAGPNRGPTGWCYNNRYRWMQGLALFYRSHCAQGRYQQRAVGMGIACCLCQQPTSQSSVISSAICLLLQACNLQQLYFDCGSNLWWHWIKEIGNRNNSVLYCICIINVSFVANSIFLSLRICITAHLLIWEDMYILSWWV